MPIVPKVGWKENIILPVVPPGQVGWDEPCAQATLIVPDVGWKEPCGVHDVPPNITAAEVGLVTASTIVLTFDEPITKTGGNYRDGFSVLVNGLANVITGESLPDSTHLRLTLTTAVVVGDVVTISYSASSGHIVDVDYGLPLADITAQAVTNNVAWSPSNISGLKLWLKADVGAGTNDGDRVSSWTDQSGSGNNSTQSDLGQRPTYKTGIKNGLPAILHDTASDQKTVTADSIAFSSAAGVSVFMVLQSNTTLKTLLHITSPGNIYLGHGEGTANKFEQFCPFLTPNGWNSGITSITGNWVLLESITSSAAINLYVNAVVDKTVTVTSGSFSDTYSIQVGGRSDAGVTHSINGYIGEVLVYDSALSAGNRQLVEAYLNGRWVIY
jgi:uncharacterized repeat protein (TIGR02059 family)